MGAEGQENIKDISKDIKEIVKDGVVKADEVAKLQKATDFLGNNKNTNEIKDEKIQKIIEKSKAEISIVVANQLKGKTKTDNKETRKTDSLSKEETQAYLNVIKRLDPQTRTIENDDGTTTEATLDNDKVLMSIREGLKDHLQDIQKKEQEAKEKPGKDMLLDILKVTTPTKEQADILLGNKEEKGRPAWEAIFSGDIITKNVDLVKSEKETDKTLLKFIALANNTGIKNITSCKVIIADESNDIYKKGDTYIQFKLEGSDIPQDIMFGKTTDVIHTARSEKFDENTYITANKKIEDIIKELDEKGSFRSFEKLVKAGRIDLKKELSNKDFLETINKQNTKDELKKNGYYNTITDYVVQKTQDKMADLSLLQSYLININATNIKYLGTDRTTQINNYNKLANLVTQKSFDKKPSVAQEVRKNIDDIQTQLEPKTKGRKEALEGGIDGFFEKFGKEIVSVLEQFGGKGCVKKLFHSLGMDDIYEKNFKKIDEKINKIYKEKFELSKDQQDGINDIIGKEKKNFSEVVIEPKDINNAIDTFKENTFKKEGDKKEKDNKAIFTEKIQEHIDLLDPKIVNKLVNKTFEKKLNDSDTGKPLNSNDFVISTGNNELKINKNLIDNKENQQILISRLFADQETRETIKNANKKIEGAVISKTNATTKEYSRSDLGDKIDEKPGEERQKYLIESESDIAKYLSAYAFAGSKSLDYVVTESDLSHPVKVIDTPQTKNEIKFNEKLASPEGVVTKEGGNKKIHEVIDMTKNPPEKISITRADGKITTEATLKKDFGQEKITTYVTTKDNKEERVQIFAGDKIDPVQKVETTKPTETAVATTNTSTEVKK